MASIPVILLTLHVPRPSYPLLFDVFDDSSINYSEYVEIFDFGGSRNYSDDLRTFRFSIFKALLNLNGSSTQSLEGKFFYRMRRTRSGPAGRAESERRKKKRCKHDEVRERMGARKKCGQ